MGKRMEMDQVPNVGQGKRGENGHLGYLLRQAASAHRLRMDRALGERGLTTPQFAVLTMLNAYPGLSNADLARLALLTPQTTNQIVAALGRSGLVSRRPHPDHGRILQVVLTSAGVDRLESCRTDVQEIEARMLAGLSEREGAAIRRWLVGIASGGTARPPGAPA